MRREPRVRLNDGASSAGAVSGTFGGVGCSPVRRVLAAGHRRWTNWAGVSEEERERDRVERKTTEVGKGVRTRG